MSRYLLINIPDNADPTVSEFSTLDAAANRGAVIIGDYDPMWPESDIIRRLKAGATLTYHDHSTIRVDTKDT
jgi:hypothetical protein